MTMRETVAEFFSAAQWPVRQTDAPGGVILETRFSSGDSEWRLLAEVREAEGILAIYSVLDVTVEPEQLAALNELLTRINLTRPVGNFDLDYETGAVSYRTGADLSDGQLTAAMTENLIYINGLTMGRYLPAIMAVLFAGGQPEMVLQKLEAELSSQEN